VAAKSMLWLMKSAALSWFHRYSADDPAYFCLPHSAARRTGRAVGRPFSAVVDDVLGVSSLGPFR